jgi:hypothetical protein
VWAPESGFGVKTATETPTNGSTVVETTTRRRILPAADLTPASRTTPDYWEYLAALDKNTDEWEHHVVYVYRVDPKPSTPVDKCTQFMTMPDGQRVPMSDREEMEFAVVKRWGGRDFRFIVKRHSERITETHILADAPPRQIVPMEPANGNGNGTTVTPYQSGTMSEAGSTAYVAGQAMHALTNQERQSAEIGFRAMETAANVMQRFGKPEGSPQDDLTRAFMNAAIARMTAPPPDPLETITKIVGIVPVVMQAIREFSGGASGTGAATPIVERIVTAALTRFENPVPTGPPVSASAELVRTLPQVAMTAVEGLREWRAGMEAQRDTVAIARGAAAVPPPQGPRPALPPQQTTAPNPAPNGAPIVQPPSLEFLESRIVAFLQEPISTVDAAEKTLDFLELNDPEGKAIEQLAALGETGLMQLFQTRTILKPATANTPRLIEFIRALLKMHAEDKAENERKPN